MVTEVRSYGWQITVWSRCLGPSFEVDGDHMRRADRPFRVGFTPREGPGDPPADVQVIGNRLIS